MNYTAVTHHRFKVLEAPATHAGNEHIVLGDAVRAITIRYPLTMRGNCATVRLASTF